MATDDIFCGSCGYPAPASAPARSESPTVAPVASAPVTPDPVGPAPTGLTPPGGAGWPNFRGRPTRPVPATDAAVGQRTPNAHYLGHRLVYDKEPEGSFDPIGNTRLLWQFFLNWLLYSVVYSICGTLAWVGVLILSIAFRSGLLLIPWVIGAILFGLLFACLYWLIPVPVQLSEWKFFVDGQAQVAPVVFDHIAWALQQRQTPLDAAQVRRLNLPGGETRDYLEISRGIFTGYISCFAYGQDLYIGWTFWFRVSPLRYFLMWLARLWQTLLRQGTDMHVKLRYDYARAMREAMHSVAREGVDVAVGEARPQGQGTVGSTVRVAVSTIDT
jgi:hypothetical protein